MRNITRFVLSNRCKWRYQSHVRIITRAKTLAAIHMTKIYCSPPSSAPSYLAHMRLASTKRRVTNNLHSLSGMIRLRTVIRRHPFAHFVSCIVSLRHPFAHFSHHCCTRPSPWPAQCFRALTNAAAASRVRLIVRARPY